ncbi:MAG: pyridoxal-phosphate dependent enzyme [Ardenticatenaceae bacterium]|nr:pyridoxal-phosphate dependent enzyme [Ardenticatenaceae bacterium]
MSKYLIKCRACGAQQATPKPIPACPACGAGWLDAVYEYGRFQPANGQSDTSWPHTLQKYGISLWRYRDLLPVQNHANIVSMGEGWTPLLHAQNLGLMLGHKHIYIKDERQGPTGSFKDRQAAIAVSAMKEAGITEAVVASTGNVAIAYSAYCARAGIKLWVFVPSSVPVEKMREMALYGSEVIKVAATYDQTKVIATEFATSKNIFLDRGIKGIAAKEGMKTVAFEIAEQLGMVKAGADPSIPNGDQHPWQVPDWFLQSVSGGLGPVGVMKGFSELKQMGLVSKLPKLGLFQPSGCAPMVHSFHKGLAKAEGVDEPMTDIITLATGQPGQAYEVLYELIQQYGGTFASVTDGEAFRALRVVAEMDGISVEPATAVTFAGLFKLIREGVIQPDETVVVNCSGHTFPVEKQIIGEHFTRDMAVTDEEDTSEQRSEGLLTALEELDSRVQRIAIIEDNPDSARLIRRILQAQGDFHIDEAHDGKSGLQLIQQNQPNLVILDLMMPGIDGFSVVEAVKKDKRLSHIPIIVVTAKELSAIERARLNGKIKALLQKGTFMDSDLLNDIRQALP